MFKRSEEGEIMRKNIAFFILPVLLLGSILVSSWGSGMIPDSEEENRATSNEAIYFGAWAEDITKFEQDAGKDVSIIHWFQRWEGTKSAFDTAYMDQVRDHGSIPLLSWEPWKGLKYGKTQSEYSLQNIIDGKFDAYITNFAKAAKAWGHPFFLRFAHEMNGDWYPWSEVINGNSRGQYVLAWRHVHDIFKGVKASNVTWVWCPGRVFGRGLSIDDLDEMYPGDDYVDWVGMDGYNAGNDNLGWQSFSDVFKHLYEKLLSITSRPIMIAETSCGEHGGHKDQWITDALSTQLPHYFTGVKALVWFNENNDPSANWEIESSQSARKAFAKAIQSSYFSSNYYSELSVSPIPPLD
jgi:beta-mannanase